LTAKIAKGTKEKTERKRKPQIGIYLDFDKRVRRQRRPYDFHDGLLWTVGASLATALENLIQN